MLASVFPNLITKSIPIMIMIVNTIIANISGFIFIGGILIGVRVFGFFGSCLFSLGGVGFLFIGTHSLMIGMPVCFRILVGICIRFLHNRIVLRLLGLFLYCRMFFPSFFTHFLFFGYFLFFEDI